MIPFCWVAFYSLGFHPPAKDIFSGSLGWSWRCFAAICGLGMIGKNAFGARVEIAIGPDALAQDGYSCEISRGYA